MDLYLTFSANNEFEIKDKIIVKNKKIYFSFICKTPINVNKLKAITGAQTAKIREFYQFVLRANDKSLK